MRNKFGLILVVTLTTMLSYSYHSANLDDYYNSIQGGFAFSIGDLEQNSLYGSAVGNIGGNILFGAQISKSWLKEFDDVDLDYLDLEEFQLGFGLGYVIRVSDEIHIVPNFFLGDSEFSAVGYHILDADTQNLGVDIRLNKGNKISTFGIDFVELDGIELNSGAASYVTSEEQALIESFEADDVVLSYYESIILLDDYDSTSYLQYGVSTADFDTFSITASLVATF